MKYYQREATAFIDGTEGLTIRQFAVYSLIIDMIYERDGEVKYNPTRIASHFEDLGVRGAKQAVKDLLSLRKLELSDGFLTNFKAESVVKAAETASVNVTSAQRKRREKEARLAQEVLENSNISNENSKTPDKSIIDQQQADHSHEIDLTQGEDKSDISSFKEKEEDKESSSLPLTLNGENATEIQSPPIADDDFSAFGILKDAGLAVQYDHRGPDFWARPEHTTKVNEWRDGHGLSRKVIVDAIKRVLGRRVSSAEPINSMKFFEAEVLASKNSNAATKPKPKTDKAKFWAKQIKENNFVSSASVNHATIQEMLGRDLVTPEQVIAAGLRIQ